MDGRQLFSCLLDFEFLPEQLESAQQPSRLPPAGSEQNTPSPVSPELAARWQEQRAQHLEEASTSATSSNGGAPASRPGSALTTHRDCSHSAHLARLPPLCISLYFAIPASWLTPVPSTSSTPKTPAVARALNSSSGGGSTVVLQPDTAAAARSQIAANANDMASRSPSWPLTRSRACCPPRELIVRPRNRRSLKALSLNREFLSFQ